MNDPQQCVPLRRGWRGDLLRIAGVLAVVAVLLVLSYYGRDYLKLLGPAEKCWEYKEVEGKLYKVNPCTGQFQLVGDAPAGEPAK